MMNVTKIIGCSLYAEALMQKILTLFVTRPEAIKKMSSGK